MPEFLSLEQSGEAGADKRLAGFRSFEPQYIEEGGEEVVVGEERLVDTVLRDMAGPGDDAGDLYRGIIHVLGKRPVALAPDAVLAEAHPVVRGEDDDGVLLQSEPCKLVQDPSDGLIHCGNGGKIAADLRLPSFGAGFVRCGKGEPWVERLVCNRGKIGIPVQVEEFLGVIRLVPRRMRGRIVDAEIEGLVSLCIPLEVADGVIGNQVGDILSLQSLDVPVTHHIRLVVGTATFGDGVPFSEPMLGMDAVAHVPFARKTTPIARFGEHVRITGQSF